MRSTFVISLIAALVLVNPALGVDPPPFDDDTPDGIPVDGGASWLLAAGVAYGVRRLRSKQRAKDAKRSG